MYHLYNLFLLVELILLRLERMFLQLGLLGTSGRVRTSVSLGEKKKKKTKQNNIRDTKICGGTFLNKYTSCGQGRWVWAMEWT